MKKYMLLYTIGPVQSYIEQASKLFDLYSGSQILSRLMMKVLEKIQENIENEIIFPYSDNTEKFNRNKDISYPNRCVAIIKTNDINEYASYLDETVHVEYSKISLNQINDEELRKKVELQIKQHLKSYWAAKVYAEELPYKEQYKDLETDMSSIKNTRYFQQNENFKNILSKCRICGEREAVFFEENASSNFTPYKRNLVRKYLKDKEKLCAVCYNKRKFSNGDMDSFQSVADIAMAGWISKLKALEGGLDLYDKYKSMFEKGYTAQLLFRESLKLDKFVLKKEFKINDVKKKLKQLEDLIEERYNNSENFAGKLYKSPYYAMIAFDGDDMGKWLKGEFYKENTDFKDAQKLLSKLLSEYAKKIRETFINNTDKETFLGIVIYAGGEDFLGAVPLSNLFKAIGYFRKEFKEIVSDKISKLSKNEKELSISMGVCIAHYKYPLNNVLKEVRKAERLAKESSNSKNSIDICLMKRSGETIQACLPWYKENIGYISKVMSEISDLFIKCEGSSSFINKLSTEFHRFLFTENAIDEIFDETKSIDMFKSEMKRLILRAGFSSDFELSDDMTVRDNMNTDKLWLIKNVEKLFDFITEKSCGKNYFSIFMSALSICEFLGREYNED